MPPNHYILWSSREYRPNSRFGLTRISEFGLMVLPHTFITEVDGPGQGRLYASVGVCGGRLWPGLSIPEPLYRLGCQDVSRWHGTSRAGSTAAAAETRPKGMAANICNRGGPAFLRGTGVTLISGLSGERCALRAAGTLNLPPLPLATRNETPTRSSQGVSSWPQKLLSSLLRR